MTSTLLKYGGALLVVILLVVGVSWWQASQASERYQRLERQVEKKLAESEINVKSMEAKLDLYRELSEAKESERQRLLQLVAVYARELDASRAERRRLQKEQQARREQTEQRVADVAGTGDAELAGQVQIHAKQVKPDAEFQAAGDFFQANRPAAEAFAEGFLRLELAEYTVTNQREQIGELEKQTANLDAQLGLQKAALEECDIREGACSDALLAAQQVRRDQTEIIRLKEEQIDALLKKTWWERFKGWGKDAGLVGLGYAMRLLTEPK